MSIELMLKERKLKVTPQRLGILSFLDQKSHPTVEEIYQAVQSEFPSVSLATVYKNVNRLYDEGILRQVNTGHVIRYDLAWSTHAHFICQHCGHVEDIMIDNEALTPCMERFGLMAKGRVGYLDMVAYGTCEGCL